ncbi:MAG: hypothetical protein ACREQ5_14155, partial [Candidatus Dormibacteria bacterium]
MRVEAAQRLLLVGHSATSAATLEEQRQGQEERQAAEPAWQGVPRGRVDWFNHRRLHSAAGD